MKPLYFKIPKTDQESFRVQVDHLPHMYDKLHYHEELQIIYIVRSRGTRFIGGDISKFKGGDIFVVGSNMPHLFKNDEKYYQEDSQFKAVSISIFLNKKAFESDFFSLPEMLPIKEFFKNADRGIEIVGETRKVLQVKMRELTKAEGFEKFIRVLMILNVISQSKEQVFISSMKYLRTLKDSDGEKLNAVFEYIMKNFTESINLHEVAEVANMSVSAFCRYFKSRTRKTVIQFINEIRIGYACTLLTEEDMSVNEACFCCGFNNVSNFNRQFKSITNLTPSQYLKKFKN
ncbi:AraC family transcriptional regulator [Rapidithrix thailandica]|uniref:AraC family transcriptional regulator n=1 Tax=Rapidithrix thailandica TaxID=413964 RepID=A0AAW9RX57_9BACT